MNTITASNRFYGLSLSLLTLGTALVLVFPGATVFGSRLLAEISLAAAVLSLPLIFWHTVKNNFTRDLRLTNIMMIVAIAQAFLAGSGLC